MKKSKTFRLDPEICEILERQAKENRRSQADQIEYLIEQEEKRCAKKISK